MKPAVSAGTRLIALLGDPVRHSLSPLFQNAALEACGLDAVYLALRCDSDAVPGLVRGIAMAGGAGNVTVPHKAVAARAVDRPTEAVVRTGVCNTFWSEDGAIHGDNTDVVGFGRAAVALISRDLVGIRALVLGAGGAARAAVWALASSGAERIVLSNRSPERAVELADRFATVSGGIEARRLEEIAPETFDLVVNATSLGLNLDDPMPLPLDSEVRFSAALDLVYSPGRTAWVNALRDRGTPAEDGLEMLLYQGAAAFERWFGVPAPVDAMRASLPPR